MPSDNLQAFWPNLTTFATAFALSAAIAIAGWFGRLQLAAPGQDRAVQRVHTGHPPRLGGVGLFFSCALAALLFLPDDFMREYYLIVVCSTPVLIFAFCEDIGIPIAPSKRFFATFISAGAYIAVSGNVLPRSGVAFVDVWLAMPWVTAILSILLISAAVQSMNLIDGLNGLCSGVAIIITLCLAYIGQSAENWLLFYISTIFCVAVIGFFVVNFPSGSIFLGDCGAYWLGFLLSVLGIYFLRIIPDLAAPALLLIFFWPAFDLSLAVWRRLVTRRHLFRPDRMHPHHVALRLMRARLGEAGRSQSANSIAAVVILLLAAPPMCLGALLWRDAAMAWTTLLVCSVVYVGLYVSAVRVPPGAALSAQPPAPKLSRNSC